MTSYREMAEESFDKAVRIDTLVHLATTLEGCDRRVPDALEELFDEPFSSWAWKQILAVKPEFKLLEKQLIDEAAGDLGEVLIDFCLTRNVLGFIARLSSPVRSFHAPDFKSASYSWGYTQGAWVYGETFDELWEAAKVWADKQRASDLAASKRKAKAVQS